MGRFPGFPDGSRYTPVPDALLGPVLDEVETLEGLKVVLRAVYLLQRKRGYPRAVAEREVTRDPLTRRACRSRSDPDVAIVEELGRAVDQGILLRGTLDGEAGRTVYLLNTEANRRALERLGGTGEAREGRPEEGDDRTVPAEPAPDRSDIFRLYEDNIGVITPLVAEELKEAEAVYPEGWIHDAFREAVERNKRSWRYVSRILRRWSQEGRGHGEPERHPASSDPKAYLRGWRRRPRE